MALTKNPFQFRLTPPGRQADSESNSDAEENPARDDEVDNAELSEEDVSMNDASDGDKRAAGSSKAEINGAKREVDGEESQPTASTSKQEPTADVSDFRKGIKIDVFCKTNFYLCYYWGVNIDQFHNFMRLNSQSFNDRLLDGSLFDQAYLERNTPKL